jgi:hypothetical protein
MEINTIDSNYTPTSSPPIEQVSTVPEPALEEAYSADQNVGQSVDILA